MYLPVKESPPLHLSIRVDLRIISPPGFTSVLACHHHLKIWLFLKNFILAGTSTFQIEGRVSFWVLFI